MTCFCVSNSHPNKKPIPDVPVLRLSVCVKNYEILLSKDKNDCRHDVAGETDCTTELPPRFWTRKIKVNALLIDAQLIYLFQLELPIFITIHDLRGLFAENLREYIAT